MGDFGGRKETRETGILRATECAGLKKGRYDYRSRYRRVVDRFAVL
jgi:hypothetical protein